MNALIAAVVSLLEKWGAAIAAFFAGRQSKELEHEKAESDAARIALDEEREIAHRLDDDAERARVRDRYRAKPGE